jgi:sigma-E factor negative regulatory protein RseC
VFITVKNPEQIEHKGTVAFVERGVVRVAIEVNEACGSCASRKACAMGSSEKREIIIHTDDAESYSVGEVVNVGARRSLGAMAVVLCYLVPLVVLVTAIIVANLLGCSDGISALVALCFTAIYYAVLALLRKNISKKITFTINKI